MRSWRCWCGVTAISRSPLRFAAAPGVTAASRAGPSTASSAGSPSALSTSVGCHVVASNRSIGERPPGVAQLFSLTDLDRMLPLCDIVVLCVGLAPETRGLIDGRRLALMKRDAFLINVGRGPVADEDVLYAALRDGTIGGAALDVWWQYPNTAEPTRPPSRHPFHELPNVVMTPHCSAWTDGMARRRGGAAPMRRATSTVLFAAKSC